MPTVMIIGASRGIGLELARQYADDGWRVHATVRTPAQPGPLGTLAGDVVLHTLDVRHAAQIAVLAAAVAQEGIDVLIHNAGVSGRGMPRAEVMAINADAPIRVAQALLPAVARRSEKKNRPDDESARCPLRAEAQSRALWGLEGGSQRRLS